MASNSLSTNVNQAITDFGTIKTAIINKGVDVPDRTHTSAYADKINNIQTGPTPPTKGFVPSSWDANGYVTDGKIYGMTSIPNYFFQGLYDTSHFVKLSNITFTSGTTTIGLNSFVGCAELTLTSLPSTITSIGNYAFSGCTKLALTSLPSGITSLSDYCFSNCINLPLTSLPPNLTNIGTRALDGSTGGGTYNTKIKITDIPSTVATIGDRAFLSCTGLASITFHGTPISINSTAFNLCTNITSIKVPWSSGAVAGAPWGATNATITYNYVP